MKTNNSKQNLINLAKSILIKVTALLAFLAINLIGYRAFSMEAAVKTDLATQIQAAEKRQIETIPACKIASEGYIDDKWTNVRIQIGQVAVAGAETISDLGAKLKQLAMEHKCLPVPVPCSFASEGLALGAWVKHRVMVEDIAFGGNTTARIFEQLGELKKIGVCQ